MKELLTVFTPTYNRKEYLKRAYGSLLAQTCHGFRWLIVDDGSEDGTEETVKSFTRESPFPIDYVKKENGGKHTAMNIAFKSCSTEYLAVSLDSDDTLTPDAVEKVIATLSDNGFPTGAVFVKEDMEGRPLFKRFSSDLETASWRDAVTLGRFEGEALLVVKSDYAGRFSYPVIENERFFTEAYVFLQMTEPFYWSRDAVYRAEYLEGGYSDGIMKSFKENPVSYRMYNDLRLRIYPSFAKRLKYAAYYDAFSILGGKKHFIKEASRPGFALLTLPFGLAFSILIRIKG